jgi:hypothetical protein
MVVSVELQRLSDVEGTGFHFPHLELLTASPPIVSQPGFGGSCAELDLEAFAKAFLAPVSVDNGCGPLCSSPR